jgi:flagellar hook-associated protein FlgK
METALEKLLDYVDNTFRDDELNDLIEEVNFRALNIYKLNKTINEIEKNTFGGTLSSDLIELKEKLTKEINRL